MQITYNGYLNSTGYSIAYQEYIYAMLAYRPDLNIKTQFVNMQIKDGVSKNRLQFLLSLSKKEIIDNHTSIYHTIPPIYKKIKNAKNNIGFSIYETINPPQKWIDDMNQMDSIITASTFNKNIYVSNGLKVPIHVVPHCFDPVMFNKDIKPLGRYDLTTFLATGTWKRRKNWEHLIKSWYEAFEKKDKVCLLIKTDKPNDLESNIIHIKTNGEWRSKSTAPIYIESKSLCTFEEIPQLMKKGDIYINCSLGEGFSISNMHAMALGIPVITTRYAGVLEYCHLDNCTYLEPQRYQSIPYMDGVPQFSNRIWPVLTIKDTAQTMRYAFQHRNEINQKAQLAYSYVHNHLSYQVIGKKFVEAIES